MKKRNVGTVERLLRIALGGAVAICAALLLLNSSSVLWRLAFIALIALGVDFVVTGIRGYCPLYNLLGWSTARPTAPA